MKKKTQKEVLAHYRRGRIETAIQEAIRYTRVLHQCTMIAAIEKIHDRLDEIAGMQPPLIEDKTLIKESVETT